jgi:hypothetical protein
MENFLIQNPISDQLRLSSYLNIDVNITDFNLQSFIKRHEKSSR